MSNHSSSLIISPIGTFAALYVPRGLPGVGVIASIVLYSLQSATPYSFSAAVVAGAPLVLTIFAAVILRRLCIEYYTTQLKAYAQDEDGHWYAPAGGLNASVLTRLARIGVNLDQKDSAGQTLLSAMVQAQNCDAISNLIRAGANLEHIVSSGKTPLTLAISKKNLEMVQILTNAGAKVIGDYGITTSPLELAVREGTPEILQHLIACGACHKIFWQTAQTLLFQAVQRRDPNILQVLVEAKVGIDAEGDASTLALIEAIQHNRSDMVQCFINAGANMNGTKERVPILIAVAMDNLEMVQLLIQAGVSLTQVDLYGRNALFLAIEKGSVEVAKVLLKAGADPNAAAYKWGALHITALERAVNAFNPKLVQLLVDGGAQITDGRALQAAREYYGHLTPMTDRMQEILKILNPATAST